MVYKIISEWKSKDGNQHELMVYRYNYSWNCLTTYNRNGRIIEIKFNTPGQLIAHSTQKINDVSMLTEDEKALVQIGKEA